MAITAKAVKNLRDLYFGELVVIYLKGMNLVIPNEEQGQIDVTPMLQGIVMDIDESFIHIGDGEYINKSIKHDDYGVIELVIASDPFMNDDMNMDGDVH